MILLFSRKYDLILQTKNKRSSFLKKINTWEYDTFYRFGKDGISFFLQIWYSEKMIFIPREYGISYDRKTKDNKTVYLVK